MLLANGQRDTHAGKGTVSPPTRQSIARYRSSSQGLSSDSGGAVVPDGGRPAQHADTDRLKSIAAIPRRVFVPRGFQIRIVANQLVGACARWRGFESAPRRGWSGRVRAESDFRHESRGLPRRSAEREGGRSLAGTAATRAVRLKPDTTYSHKEGGP
jgi:hypothetical protein